MAAFDTTITEQQGVLSGPYRSPKQMLAVQAYDGHASIHDDATAQKLGFKGGTIEGPTHFSQFAPLGLAVWGKQFLISGCISAHYRAPAFEGEEVQAFLRAPGAETRQAEIWMLRSDGVGFFAARHRSARTFRFPHSMHASPRCQRSPIR